MFSRTYFQVCLAFYIEIESVLLRYYMCVHIARSKSAILLRDESARGEEKLSAEVEDARDGRVHLFYSLMGKAKRNCDEIQRWRDAKVFSSPFAYKDELFRIDGPEK